MPAFTVPGLRGCLECPASCPTPCFPSSLSHSLCIDVHSLCRGRNYELSELQIWDQLFVFLVFRSQHSLLVHLTIAEAVRMYTVSVPV